MIDTPRRSGIPLRTIAPNAVTALALCCGLSAVRFGIGGEWDKALFATVAAGVLDGIDGRVARLFRSESRFGAELDSLSDVIAFGVAPAVVMFLWSLGEVAKFGWIVALMFALCCALRLARFNAAIDDEEKPHKSAGFLTGVPAPAAAGLAYLPIYIWLETGIEAVRSPLLVAPWLVFVAILMISSIATFSWGSVRPRRNVRLELIGLIALIGAALFSVPWIMLAAISVIYVLLIPFSIRSYARIKRPKISAGQNV